MAKKNVSTFKTSDYDYKALKVRGSDGKVIHSSGNGDAIHRAMLLHLSKGGTVKQLVEANKLNVNLKSGNAGTQRMSCGVALRAKVKGGDSVKVGSVKVEKLSQKVELPKFEPKVRAAAPKKAKKAKAKKSAPRRKAAAQAEAAASQA